MQDGLTFEREALTALPRLLLELFDQQAEISLVQGPGSERGFDAIAQVNGRDFIFEIKNSSRAGTVAAAADQLRDYVDVVDGIGILVVPQMTPAGEKVAREKGLNWIDLAGNASIREGDHLYIYVSGNRAPQPRGRPSSPFAPKSARVTRAMLLDPERWWLQKELARITDLDAGTVSRVVKRLGEERLLSREEGRVRPVDPYLLLDAWSDDYRFDRHDAVHCHLTGSGFGLARTVSEGIASHDIQHAFTGLAAAWAMTEFAGFRLVSVYVNGDPFAIAREIGARTEERGANVEVIGPDDAGVFFGQRDVEGVPCVAPPQAYLDLTHLPERAPEAAKALWRSGKLWDAAA